MATVNLVQVSDSERSRKARVLSSALKLHLDALEDLDELVLENRFDAGKGVSSQGWRSTQSRGKGKAAPPGSRPGAGPAVRQRAVDAGPVRACLCVLDGREIGARIQSLGKAKPRSPGTSGRFHRLNDPAPPGAGLTCH